MSRPWLTPAALALSVSFCGGLQTADPSPTVVDPGGPFAVPILGERRLSDLEPPEIEQLCAAVTNAKRTFLEWAVAAEQACRMHAYESAFVLRRTDAGTQAQQDRLFIC